MNNLYLSSSFNSYNNGIQTNNEEQYLNFSNEKGEYKKYKFGKIIENKKINRKDIDEYFNNRGFIISNRIFNDAINIINNTFSNFEPIEFPIYKGLKNKESKKLFTIDNEKKEQKKSSKCNLIEKKYKLSGDNKKNSMKKIYKKKSLNIHPDKCKTKECETKFKELSLDYDNYLDIDNNC